MDVKKMLKYILIIFFLFVVVFAVFRYGITLDTDRGESVLLKRESGPEHIDRAFIVEDSEDAFNIRINMLDQAEKSVDLAYYKILVGDSSYVFFQKLIETADRGVKVRIYLDGIVNKFNKGMTDLEYALYDHPNIEYRLHEPLNLLKPWNFNYRLHDKIILVDGSLGIIGGRNIGDRFFISDRTDKNSVFDRDVLIYNDNSSPDSVIKDMENYYNALWESEFSKPSVKRSTARKTEKGQEALKNLKLLVDDLETSNEFDFYNLDFKKLTRPVKRVEFVHNTIGDWKDQKGLKGIFELAESADSEIILQSPYIIFSQNMKKLMRQYEIDFEKVHVLTNSYYSSPNLMAVSGYHNFRKKMIDRVDKVYEYHGGNSIHGKSYIFDEEISIIGSFNLDPRSVYLSSEAYLVFYDQEFSRDLKSNIEELESHSLYVNKDYEYEEEFKGHESFQYKAKKFIIGIVSKIVYFFDYML